MFNTRPVDNIITSHFRQRKHPVTGKPDLHSGIDIKAKTNTAVLSADDGVVIWSDEKEHKEYGYAIIIKHSDGTSTLYANLKSQRMAYGKEVVAGEIIGLIGNTRNSKTSKLHFEHLGKEATKIVEQYGLKK